jgi:LmbE family N-acetylglucosaminyl deacetylase
MKYFRRRKTSCDGFNLGVRAMKRVVSRRRKCPNSRWLGLLASLTLVFQSTLFNTSAENEPASPSPAVLQDLRCFREMGSVLHIAAHPDDENTQLLAYLARGRGYRTAYLSLTRGDGGQNVLGSDFGEKLGVARTQELLAARRLDGAQQFFTRALDFGFSKDYEETLRVWNKQEVLSDIVRVIRTFRPDVIITRFPPRPSGTHGHHTASAVLALEAFKLAGDSKAFPEHLKELSPWQPKRILWNGGGDSKGGGVKIDIGGNDPVLGVSFSELAGRSRAMHKTQGFGSFGGRGGGRLESFELLDGEPARKDILDGVDTTWARVSGGAEIGKLADEAIEKFNAEKLSANLPGLLAIRSRLATHASDPLVADKKLQLDRIIQKCLRLTVQTTIANAEIVPGEEVKMQHSAIILSDVPVRWKAVRYPGLKRELDGKVELHPNQLAELEGKQTLPSGTPISQPYWLRSDSSAGMFHVDDPALIGRPENPPVFPIENVFEVGGQALVVHDEPVQVSARTGKDDLRRRLDVIPPVSLKFPSAVQIFSPGKSRTVSVEVTAARSEISGTLRLNGSAGWSISPAAQTFHLSKSGDHATFNFTVTAPSQSATTDLGAVAQIGGIQFDRQRVEVRYDHIPLVLLQSAARLKAVDLDLATKGQQVGYFPGAGDDVAQSLEQMGYKVTILDVADLAQDKLQRFDAVVVGVRALDTRKDLGPKMLELFSYVESGGNVIMQYNRVDGLQKTPLTLHVSQSRVTDETAPVTFLAPDHPALNTPNKITGADFDGWVQERGTYFPTQWDERFTPIVASSDSGEPPLKGGLLVAKYGRGYFVYTGLTFFRQLPAGVPGAYRIFANLVSLGK